MSRSLARKILWNYFNSETFYLAPSEKKIVLTLLLDDLQDKALWRQALSRQRERRKLKFKRRAEANQIGKT
jgi:hypothetical protein